MQNADRNSPSRTPPVSPGVEGSTSLSDPQERAETPDSFIDPGDSNSDFSSTPPPSSEQNDLAATPKTKNTENGSEEITKEEASSSEKERRSASPSPRLSFAQPLFPRPPTDLLPRDFLAHHPRFLFPPLAPFGLAGFPMFAPPLGIQHQPHDLSTRTQTLAQAAAATASANSPLNLSHVQSAR